MVFQQPQGPCFSKMMSAGLHLDQRNPEKIETDEWTHGVSPTLFQGISFQLQLNSVWRMVAVSQGETMSQQRLCQAPLSFPCHDNLKDTRVTRTSFTILVQWSLAMHQTFLIAHWFPKLWVCSISSRSSILPVVLTMWLELTTNLGKYWHTFKMWGGISQVLISKSAVRKGKFDKN